MSTATSIEWTDRTWNPVRGCALVSEGCRNCYAMKQAHRFSGPGKPYEGLTRLGPNGPTWTGDTRTVDGALEEPLRWRKPQKVFVNSMSDLFHPDVPDAFIDRVFAAMALTPQHTYQVLTKRPERMRDYVNRTERRAYVSNQAARIDGDPDPDMVVRFWPLLNVWLGVSVETQDFADERIPLLLQTPAAVRFISAEPLLGPVDLTWLHVRHRNSIDALRGWHDTEYPDQPRRHIDKLDWVIVGGESGPSSRAFRIGWARSIVAQCTDAGVAVFVKQLGAKPQELYNGVEVTDLLLRDKKGGDMTEWPSDLRVREFPERRADD